jgi:hypothetical protein
LPQITCTSVLGADFKSEFAHTVAVAVEYVLSVTPLLQVS